MHRPVGGGPAAGDPVRGKTTFLCGTRGRIVECCCPPLDVREAGLLESESVGGGCCGAWGLKLSGPNLRRRLRPGIGVEWQRRGRGGTGGGAGGVRIVVL